MASILNIRRIAAFTALILHGCLVLAIAFLWFETVEKMTSVFIPETVLHYFTIPYKLMSIGSGISFLLGLFFIWKRHYLVCMLVSMCTMACLEAYHYYYFHFTSF